MFLQLSPQHYRLSSSSFSSANQATAVLAEVLAQRPSSLVRPDRSTVQHKGYHPCQKTKFDYVVSCLDPEYATEVRDLLLTLPADEPYETLNAQLTKRTSASEQRRIQELLSTEELGDRTSSEMLRRI